MKSSIGALKSEIEGGFFENLNDKQKEAVLTTEGPLLVLAGAGTGKTRVLSFRAAHILKSGLCSPEQILAVTFTNKAALEMKERIISLIGEPCSDMWIGTFHSITVKILRAHGELIDINPRFSILDEEDQIRLVKNIIGALNLDDKQFSPRNILSYIKKWKDRGLLPHQLGLAMGPVETVARRVFKEYQERLKILEAMDFGDMILYTLNLFKKFPEILEKYQKLFHYILVDEYQDTNMAQYLLLKYLAGFYKNLCCVGDDDQSIYSWRGAEVGNILKFEKDFEGAKIIRLERNYRSSDNILKAANALISNNIKRLGKNLWTDWKTNNLIYIKHAWNSEDEARFISNEIEKLHKAGEKYSSMALLVRAGFQTREFEERFLRQAIPYQVVGGLRFYERKEIRDSIAYIRFLISNKDSLAFERIINVPKRSIGETTIHKIHIIATKKNISLAEASQEYAAETRGKASQAIRNFLSTVEECRELLKNTPPATVVRTLLDRVGYIAMWKSEKTTESLTRLENIKELINAIADFDSLEEFIDHVSLVLDKIESEDQEVISIMTIHGAKGLEFKTLFLAGWEEGLFPHQKTIQEAGVLGLDEERRLAYVALTRAKENIYISYCSHRKTNSYGWQMSVPSRFVRELPPDCVVFLDKKGVNTSPIQDSEVRDISEEQTAQEIQKKYKFI